MTLTQAQPNLTKGYSTCDDSEGTMYTCLVTPLTPASTSNRLPSSCNSYWVFGRPVQSWLLGPNQRSTQLSRYEFEPNQRSNQIFGSKFKLLPYQRFYQISWFNLKPNQRSSQIPGFTFVPNQSLNQIVCKIILGFNHRDEYSHIEKKLRLKL